MLRRQLAAAATLLVLPALLTAFQTPPSKGTPAPRPAPGNSKPAARPAAKAASKTPALPPIKNSPGQTWTESIVTVPIIGHVTAYVPKTPASSVMLFLSGDGRWNLGVIDWARRIMPKAIVLGVDFVALKNAHPTSGTCWLPTGDLETISHAAQRALNLPEYHPPILVGYSSGATLVYEALAAGPSNTFAGGLSLGFCPDLPALQPVCPAENFRPTYDPKKYTAWLPKVTDLKHEWYVLNGELDQVCLPPETHKFLDGMQGAHFIEIPHTGHGFGKQQYWSQPLDDSIDALIKAATTPKAKAPAPPSAAALESKLGALGLPLEYRWAELSRAVMIFISGDGGWATIDDKLSAYLAAHGVSVVGISSLRYFWNLKTPQQAGADLQRVAATLESANLPLFIGGYSFGAEVTPFVLETWPETARRNVAGQILIGPGETASFEISPMDWIFRAKETPRRVADQVRALRVPTFCLAGQQEEARDTACDEIAAVGESVRLPGSHHFNARYDDVGRVVLAFIEKHLKARP